jgi:hypothetical protein
LRQWIGGRRQAAGGRVGASSGHAGRSGAACQQMSLLASTSSAPALPRHKRSHTHPTWCPLPRGFWILQGGRRQGPGQAGRQGGAVGGLRRLAALPRSAARCRCRHWLGLCVLPPAVACSCSCSCSPDVGLPVACALVLRHAHLLQRGDRGRAPHTGQTARALARGECCRWGQPAARRQESWPPAPQLPLPLPADAGWRPHKGRGLALGAGAALVLSRQRPQHRRPRGTGVSIGHGCCSAAASPPAAAMQSRRGS